MTVYDGDSITYDAIGNPLARYTYDTWGKTVAIVDASGNMIQLNGKYKTTGTI